MARPLNANAEETRERILDAALRRFGSDGLDRSSLRAIGADAGVTFATVHHYFGSKADLYERCLDASYEALGDLRPALGETLSTTPGGLEAKLEAVARRAFAFARDRAVHSRFLLRATLYEQAATPRTREAQRRYLDVTSEVLAPVLGRPKQELRVPLQGLMFLLTRMAVMTDDELTIIGGDADGPTTQRQLADYIASVALETLLPGRNR